jgi:hypothetical protein
MKHYTIAYTRTSTGGVDGPAHIHKAYAKCFEDVEKEIDLLYPDCTHMEEVDVTNRTIILGICEVNTRRYFVGMWPSIADAIEQLKEVYTVKAIPHEKWDEIPTYGPHPTQYKAVSFWGADDTGVDMETLENKKEDYVYPVGSDVDGFNLYEMNVGDLPGYLSFDED